MPSATMSTCAIPSRWRAAAAGTAASRNAAVTSQPTMIFFRFMRSATAPASSPKLR